MYDWCRVVSKQRELSAASADLVREVRALESELIYLNGGAQRNKSEEVARDAVKSKFDLMRQGLQEMCMGETGTVFQMDELGTWPAATTEEDLEVYKETVQKNREKWDWLGRKQEELWEKAKNT